VATPPRYQRRRRDPRPIAPLGCAADNMLRRVPTDTPEALAEALAAAVGGGDIRAAAALWVDDAVMIGPDGQTVRGRDAIAAALQALVDSGARMQIDVSSVFAAGDAATVLGTLTLSGSNGNGGSFSETADSVVVYSRGPDGWRIAIDAPWGLPGRTGAES
jgi:uncharacterized protein (TIGR02246 family)